MMLESWRISRFYCNSKLEVPKMWNLSRKHFRIQTLNGRFIKLNKFRNRLNERVQAYRKARDNSTSLVEDSGETPILVHIQTYIGAHNMA
jgi:hypothetical protein